MNNIIQEYLTLIQEEKIPTKWRKRVEVFILKDNKFVMGYNKKFNKYLPPGGGVEDNESLEKAVRRESLEEIGVKINKPVLIVKDPYKIDYYGKKTSDHEFPGLERHKKEYRGTMIYFMKATFNSIDKSIYGKEGDAMKRVEINKNVYFKQLQKEKREMNKYKLKILRSI